MLRTTDSSLGESVVIIVLVLFLRTYLRVGVYLPQAGSAPSVLHRLWNAASFPDYSLGTRLLSGRRPSFPRCSPPSYSRIGQPDVVARYFHTAVEKVSSGDYK